MKCCFCGKILADCHWKLGLFFHTLRFPASLGETHNVRVQLSAKAGAPLPAVCPA